MTQLIRSQYIIFLVFMATGHLVGSVAFAQTNDFEVFEAPQRKEAVAPSYPKEEALKGAEGWVVLNFMVDKEGKVFEPTVVDATGSKEFIEVALKAANKSTYTPASIKGVPVEGSAMQRYTFRMNYEQDGARRSFARRYKKYIEALKSKDAEKAQSTLDDLESKETLNHYENAYLDYARYLFAIEYGTDQEQHKFLNRALLMSTINKDKFVALPPDLEVSSLRDLFTLEVKLKHYAEAISAFDIWMEKYPDEIAEPYKNAYQQVLAIKDAPGGYSYSGATNENGYWSGDLYKRGFYIDGQSNEINEIKLRCDRKYVFFAFEAGNQYQLPESWGDCRLEVLGAADIKFNITQFTEG